MPILSPHNITDDFPTLKRLARMAAEEQAAEERAEATSDAWVPVSTRLPDSPDSDLDCIVERIGSPEDREIAKCFYDGTAWWFSGCRPVEAQQCRVTHWLPARILPPMPEPSQQLFMVECYYTSGWADAEWTEDGKPMRFYTVGAAQEEINELVSSGHHMGYVAEDYRVVPAPTGEKPEAEAECPRCVPRLRGDPQHLEHSLTHTPIPMKAILKALRLPSTYSVVQSAKGHISATSPLNYVEVASLRSTTGGHNPVWARYIHGAWTEISQEDYLKAVREIFKLGEFQDVEPRRKATYVEVKDV